MIEIELGWFVVLIILASPTLIFLLFTLIYFIALAHDLWFVRYHKPNKCELNCPYEKEGNDK